MATTVRRVKTVQRLRKLAESKRAVEYVNFSRPIPAVFVLNMTCSVVLRMIDNGLFEYRKGGK